MKAKLIAVIILSNIISMGTISADSHEDAEAEAVLSATKNFNATANSGEWEEHFSYYAVGCSEFWQEGMLRNRFGKNDEGWGRKINNMKEWTSRGGIRSIYLRHPEVAMHGDVAVATTYQHGWFKPPEGERKDVLSKVTFVWKKTDEGWKIVHLHFSDMKRKWE